MGLAKTGLADTSARNSGCPVSYSDWWKSCQFWTFNSLARAPQKFITFTLLVSRLKLIFPLVDRNYRVFDRILKEEEEEKEKIRISFEGEKKNNRSEISTRKNGNHKLLWREERGEANRNCDKIDIARLFIIDWTVRTVRYVKGYPCKV